jgi:hypothetical protein
MNGCILQLSCIRAFIPLYLAGIPMTRSFFYPRPQKKGFIWKCILITLNNGLLAIPCQNDPADTVQTGDSLQCAGPAC